MPEILLRASTSVGSQRLLFNQLTILRLFVLGYAEKRVFDTNYFGAPEKWKALTKELEKTEFTTKITEFSSLGPNIKNEFLLEAGFELAQLTETAPIWHFDPPFPESEYIIDDLLTVKNELLNASAIFPKTFPTDMRPYAFWKHFFGEYTERMFWVFAIWLLKEKAGKTNADLWGHFKDAFQSTKENFHLKKELTFDQNVSFALNTATDALKTSLCEPIETIDAIVPYIFFDFANNTNSLFQLPKLEYLKLIKEFLDTNIFADTEIEFISGLSGKPTDFDLVLNLKIEPFIDLESRNSPSLDFKFAKSHIDYGIPISADVTNHEWLAIATNVSLWHPEQAEVYLLTKVSDFLNKLQFLSSGIFTWRPLYIKWRPSGARPEVGYGLKRFEPPSYSFSTNTKSVDLLNTLTTGNYDAGFNREVQHPA